MRHQSQTKSIIMPTHISTKIKKFSSGLTLALEIIADEQLKVTFANRRDEDVIQIFGKLPVIALINRYVADNTDDF